MFDNLEDLDIEDLEYMVLVGQSNNILVVDDEEVIHQVMKKVLKDPSYHVDFAKTGEDAIEKVREKEYNLLIVDKNLPGISGIEVMAEVRELRNEIEFIVITAYASYESAVEALKLGAFDYLEKPFDDLKILAEKVRRALDRQHLTHENRVLSDHLRAAHKDLKGTLDVLGKSLGDMEKVNLYLRSMVGKSTRELKIQNTELKRAINVASQPLRLARDALRKEVAATGAPGVCKARDLLERAWEILASSGRQETKS